MTIEPVELLGLVAGMISTFAALPQMVKIIRTRRAEDVSLVMFLMAFTGAVMWAAYGFLKPAASIVFWNVVAVVQMGSIIVIKLVTDRRNAGAAATPSDPA
jgi:MtN3 and saliva related transmembrane protein